MLNHVNTLNFSSSRCLAFFELAKVSESEHMKNSGTYSFVLYDVLQIKRCGEMARKLRFFKEQMTKAGVVPSTRPMSRADIVMDDLEVYLLLKKLQA